ncbi:MAG: glycoside hydrolase family 16 protein [Calditrichaeota bacterium]|nr:MAG: glycoside hydrolase family 16 protein [Calditrichota bacterium]
MLQTPKKTRVARNSKKFIEFLLLAVLFIFSYCKKVNAPEEGNMDKFNAEWQLVWQDEFNTSQIDGSKWNFEIGAGGWGNDELEFYTNRHENAYIENGQLVIEARKDNYQGNTYTSARMTTKNKGDWLYGRIEVRARLPRGQGLWPAIWMMPTDNYYGSWAASGEIDIMELLGNDVNTVYGTIHYGGSFPANVHSGAQYKLSQAPNFADGFHTFALEWDSTKISWFVDDSLYQEQSDWYTGHETFPAPFNKRFFLILNVAVGGTWPGYPDASTTFPQKMRVEYVRVYQKP